MSSARLPVVVMIAMLAGCAIAAADTADVVDDPSRWWPRAVVVVMERRIPDEAKKRGPVGPQLRRLREQLVEQLAGPAVGLRPRDHIFIFADGMSEVDFACLTRSEHCDAAGAGVKPLNWTRGQEAAAAFLRHMLRLPRGPRRSGGVVEIGAHQDTEFLHTVYDGSLKELDCAIRREITGPMTGVSVTNTDACPVEGDTVDTNASRAISRAEQSVGVQITAALESLGRERPVAGVTWVWALLNEKNYLQEDTLHGIRREHGQRQSPRSAAVGELFRAAYSLYATEERLTHSFATGEISVRGVHWMPTVEAWNRLNQKRSLLSLSLGREKTHDLSNNPRIERSFIGGQWTPVIDHFDIGAQLDASLATQLLQGAVDVAITQSNRIHVGPNQAVDRQLSLREPSLDEDYRRSLSRFPAEGRFYAMNLALLVSGERSPRAPVYAPIPRAVLVQPTLGVAPRPPTSLEVIVGGVMSVLSVGFIVVFVRALRRLPFELAVDRPTLTWTLPGGDDVQLLEIVGYSDNFHRRLLRGRTDLTLEWQVFLPLGMPVAGDQPLLDVTVNHTPVRAATPARLQTSWKPGPRKAPRTLATIALRLDAARIDTSSLTSPQSFGFRFELKVEARMAAPLRLLPAVRPFSLPVQVRLEEVRPAPKVTFEIDSLYRRLGFATAEPRSCATLRITNHVEGHIPRPVKVSARVVVAPEARHLMDATFEREASPAVDVTVPGNSEFVERVLLVPTVARPDSLVKVPLSVEVVTTDSGTPDRPTPVPVMSHVLDWIPSDAHVVGLDLGTSGARLILDRGVVGEELAFPLHALDGRDGKELEFPSLSLFDPEGHVVRVGLGVIGPQPPGYTIVESPKGRLLTANTATEYEATARFSAYVAAMGRVWNAIHRERQLGSVRMVVTVPHDYGIAKTNLYLELIRHHFTGVVLVAHLREAEAAAYFQILNRIFTLEDAQRTLPTDRPFRTLVVDLGAGTTDFALIEAETSGGRVTALRSGGNAAVPWAGDRYDQMMLAALFRPEVSALLANDDGRQRQDAREFKERSLEKMLSEGRPLTVQGWGAAKTASAAEFLERMEPFFETAIDKPLQRLANEKGVDRLIVDQILFAGRGTQAYGCTRRIVDTVGTLFKPPAGERTIPVTSFSAVDTTHGIARGAVVFGRRGDVLIGNSDLGANRHLSCLIEAPGERQVHSLYSKGQTIDAKRTFPITSKRPIEGAWVVATASPLLPGQEKALIARLVLLKGPPAGSSIIGKWRPQAETRELAVRVFSDERADIERPESTGWVS
jgi:hypothetical protein